MNILSDEIIDAKSDICWRNQQAQAKRNEQLSCICLALAEMIETTRLEVAKKIDRLCDDECQYSPHHSTTKNIYYHNGHNAAADIARGLI